MRHGIRPYITPAPVALSVDEEARLHEDVVGKFFIMLLILALPVALLTVVVTQTVGLGAIVALAMVVPLGILSHHNAKKTALQKNGTRQNGPLTPFALSWNSCWQRLNPFSERHLNAYRQQRTEFERRNKSLGRMHSVPTGRQWRPRRTILPNSMPER